VPMPMTLVSRPVRPNSEYFIPSQPLMNSRSRICVPGACEPLMTTGLSHFETSR
jgi:hypothetical protein